MGLKIILMILYVAATTVASQLLLKSGLNKIKVNVQSIKDIYAFVIAALTNWQVMLSLGIQAVGFVVWILVVSKIKLGLAFAVSGSLVYVIMALASWYFFRRKNIPDPVDRDIFNSSRRNIYVLYRRLITQ